MLPDVSRPEFELLKDLIENGFTGVHARLDKLNSRTEKLEDKNETIATRIVSIEAQKGRIDYTLILAVIGLLISAAAAYAALTH